MHFMIAEKSSDVKVQRVSRLPVDFDLCPHNNERTAALAHLKALQASDVIVYDRGYYSFELLYATMVPPSTELLPSAAPSSVHHFVATPDQADTIVSILPGPEALRDLSRKHPGSSWQPVPLRLVKYTHGGTEYILGTTLLDRRRYRVADLSDLHHARWGIEELYKVSKQFLEVDQFHGRSERLVKQELFAHFNLIAMTRLFTNRDAGTAGQLQAQPGRAGAEPGRPAAAPHRICQRDSRAHLHVGRDRSAQATLQPLVPAALAAASPEMVAAQSRYRLAKSTPTPMNMP